jgi:hypothetical protein
VTLPFKDQLLATLVVLAASASLISGVFARDAPGAAPDLRKQAGTAAAPSAADTNVRLR